MKRNILFPFLVCWMMPRRPAVGVLTAILTLFAATGCTDDTDSGNRLPPGTYPMTFIAGVDGLTATRATTDNNGKTAWEKNDLVAISMDGGANYKQYKISDASIGAMLPDGEANTLYWQKSDETKTLAAWYPVSCTVGTNTGSGEVNITDQNTGFGALENILHAPAKEYTYSSVHPVAFTFRHALAKVKVTLKKGDGIEDSDLSTATVTFTGYTAGTLGYDGMTGSGTNGDITPKKETPGGTPTYTALVIPQQMQGKKFIKVTVGTDNAARDYFYTPTNSTGASLEAGKQYAYTITVKKTGLEVTVTNNGTSWTDTSTGVTPDASVTFHITAPTSGVTITASGSGGTLTDNGNGSYTLSGGNAVSITADARIGIKGLYEVAGDKKTYTLKSDLLIEYSLADAQTGDFYCKTSDGSTGYLIPGDISDLTPEQKAACLGVVMKVGKDNNGDWKDDCVYKLKDGVTSMPVIHGYVLALYDATTCTWATFNAIIGTDQAPYAGFYGYKNTNIIKKYAAEKEKVLQTDFPATYYTTVAYEGSYASPANSSGWFLPSAGQCWYWFQHKDVLLSSVKKASGNENYSWKTFYWSSSEGSDTPAYNAWYLDFDASYVVYSGKYSDRCVRACLAF